MGKISFTFYLRIYNFFTSIYTTAIYVHHIITILYEQNNTKTTYINLCRLQKGFDKKKKHNKTLYSLF